MGDILSKIFREPVNMPPATGVFKTIEESGNRPSLEAAFGIFLSVTQKLETFYKKTYGTEEQKDLFNQKMKALLAFRFIVHTAQSSLEMLDYTYDQALYDISGRATSLMKDVTDLYSSDKTNRDLVTDITAFEKGISICNDYSGLLTFDHQHGLPRRIVVPEPDIPLAKA